MGSVSPNPGTLVSLPHVPESAGADGRDPLIVVSNHVTPAQVRREYTCTSQKYKVSPAVDFCTSLHLFAVVTNS